MRVRNQRLPTGYREVEYLESTGTQWIDSNVSIAAKSNMKCKVIWTNISGSYPMLYGAWDIFALSSMPSQKLCIASGGYSGNNPLSSGPTISANVLYEINHLPNKLTINETEYTIPNAGVSNTANDRHILLFAASISNTGNTPYNWSTYAKAKVYYFKLYNDTTLVRNFIPCIRTSDNKPGLYDTVNSTFYTNQGTGEFLYGPYHDSYKLPIYPRLPSNYQGSGTFTKGSNVNYILDCTPKTTLVPSAYQEVEYIEAVDFSNIESEITPTGTTKVQLKIRTNSNGQYNFGTRANTSTSSSSTYEGINWRLFSYNSKWYGDLGKGSASGGNNRIIGGSISASTVYELEYGNHYIKDLTTNTILIEGTTVANVSYSNTYTLGLFKDQLNPSTGISGSRVYWCKIYDAGKLVRHFIPCCRKSDNVIGMWDTIHGKFYTNAGTGTFTKGNNKYTII